MKPRNLNGYKVVHVPEHFDCMRSKNWSGYQYEHKYLVEKRLGRALRRDEVVHHKDGDKTNNSLENLEVLTRSEHAKRHAKYPTKHCSDCGAVLKSKRASRCRTCANINSRKVERPPISELVEMVKSESFSAIGRKYGVSDNTIRKWLKAAV